MALFAGFVFWNGGVVLGKQTFIYKQQRKRQRQADTRNLLLGDKSNHVATIHLPQMLYIWPLFAFFSAPLLLRTVVSAIDNYRRGINFRPSGSILGYVSLLPLALAIVKFNTIIHPFTLADNRHYMFYVFRYSILRASWVRYALVPAYVLSGVLCLKTLGGAGSLPWADRTTAYYSPRQKKETAAPTTTRRRTGQEPRPPLTRPPTLSTAVLFLVATTLSLVTAPLVEPRYFILPWVFWRLLLPAWWSPPGGPGGPTRGTPTTQEKVPFGGDSGVALLETTWFAVINVATMYIFITRPFAWASEEGLQRFMW